MQVTVFGANGKVGRLIVRMLLARHHTVVAFVHRKHSFKESKKLIIHKGDIHNPHDVDAALAGSDAVISALGSWGTSTKDVLTTATTHIVTSMEARGIRTIISLTGAEARIYGDPLGRVHRMMHAVLSVMTKRVLVDGERHTRLLADSGLDWTVVRSPIMTSTGVHKPKYHVDTVRPVPWEMISRQAVALAMVTMIKDRHWSNQAPFIHK